MRALKLVLGLAGGVWDVALAALIEILSAALTGKLPRRWIRRLILRLARILVKRTDTDLDDRFLDDLTAKLERGSG